MPELPEVETVKRGIAPVMEGYVLTQVDQNRPDLRWPFPDGFADRLTGRTVIGLRRRAKYILADLDDGQVLLIHLGMSGRMMVEGIKQGHFEHETGLLPQHNHVVFHLSSDATITFNDPRRFGAMDLFHRDAEDQYLLIRNLGPEPLGNELNEDYLFARMEGRRTPMKSFLLDQRNIAGLGNIYVCEVLWRCGISPRRLAGNVPKAKAQRLIPAIRDVLTEAIDAGGSSLRDHRQANGDLGYFQHNFAVYDQEGADCPKDDCNGKIARIVQSGRSSFYCNTCQR
ncbi:MAG: bifunctional DNA-formamidopyrimidine glycosylase/DNA-(apurinic or apyrimidinic site) lyase [Pseudomonadota bacterium]